MPTLLNWFRQPIQIAQTLLKLAPQVMHRTRLRLRSQAALVAKTLFLKKQLALYQEPNTRWRCDWNATRVTLVWLSYWFDWQPALTIVQPATFKRWRRQGWRLLWTSPAKPGRPPIPPELQALTRRMARENVTWGQKRIANELLLKLGLRVSPRTVRKYMPSDCVGGPGKSCSSQRWSTFIRNHARDLVVMGVPAEMTRKTRSMLAHIRRFIQGCLDWSHRDASSPMKPHTKLAIFCLDDVSDIPGVVSLNGAKHTKRVEKSPPEKRLSGHAGSVRVVEPGAATRAEVRSVIPTRNW